MNQPPKLDTPEARDAYRRELRRVAQPLRLAGLGVVVAGALLAIVSRSTGWRPPGLDVVILGALAVGWLILFYVIYRRSQYHRRRMAGR